MFWFYLLAKCVLGMFYIVGKFLRIPRRIKAKFYMRWNLIKFYLCGVSVGKGCKLYNKIYLYIGREGIAVIGDEFHFTSGDCLNPLCRNLKGGITINQNASLRIGNNVGISSGCIWVHQSIVIGNNVNIGGDCILMDSDAHSLNYLYRRDGQKDQKFKINKGTVIDDDVLVGARCIILKGVHIGARSIIGAGSVVTNDIPADCIAGGNPCRLIRNINQTI